MDLTTIEASIRHVARRMDDLDPRRDREEWMDLCRERQTLQARRWATLRPQAAPAPQAQPQRSPGAVQWVKDFGRGLWHRAVDEDGLRVACGLPIPGAPYVQRKATWQPDRSTRCPECDALEAPDWPDAPTEEAACPA